MRHEGGAVRSDASCPLCGTVGEPGSRAIAVPFTDEELALITERAAAHGVVVLEFLRYCALTQATPLELGAAGPSGGSR